MRVGSFLTAFALSLPIYAAKDPVVDVGYATYRGNASTEFPGSVAYLGIPYAEPPVGNLRFRAPLPLNTARVSGEAGGKVVDATQYPNFCIQGSIGGLSDSLLQEPVRDSL
jgi:carboxylesterase type B